jgi:hypothetical protein
MVTCMYVHPREPNKVLRLLLLSKSPTTAFSTSSEDRAPPPHIYRFPNCTNLDPRSNRRLLLECSIMNMKIDSRGLVSSFMCHTSREQMQSLCAPPRQPWVSWSLESPADVIVTLVLLWTSTLRSRMQVTALARAKLSSSTKDEDEALADSFGKPVTTRPSMPRFLPWSSTCAQHSPMTEARSTVWM